MPPLPTRERGSQPVIDWIERECAVDRSTATKAFESAKQAKYLVLKPFEGKSCWHFDARSGYTHWHKPTVGTETRPLVPLLPEDTALVKLLVREEPSSKDEALKLALDVWSDETDARASLNRLHRHGLINGQGMLT